MGRSVSTPSRCAAVAYQTFSVEGDDMADASDAFDFFIEDIQEQVKALWPSFDACDSWIDREDHAIMENNHSYIGVSEYCGQVAIWLVSKAEASTNKNYGYLDGSDVPLANNFCKLITPKFLKNFNHYNRLGTFSNGESVYEKVA